MHKSGISLEKLNKIAFLRVLKTIVFKYYIDKQSISREMLFLFLPGYETDERGSLG